MRSANALLQFSIFFASSIHAQSDYGQIVTSSGPVTGHDAKDRPGVVEYLGIPYAQPPIGDLRFEAPKAFNSSKPIVADTFSPDCPQQGLTAPPLRYDQQTPQFKSIVEAFAGGRGNAQSEDCLTLNIWAKKASAYGPRGVLVWFHGGRFTLGDSNTPFYTGKHLAAAEDIIVVTVNYRLNMFGFSGAPGQPLNVGLLDQRKAIEWVRDNIGAFGGDPSHITIMGQSAGGATVDFYAYAYKDDPIVAGLISHSGTAFSFDANTPEYAQQSFMDAASSLNCTPVSYSDTCEGDCAEKVVACMRKVPTAKLLTAMKACKPLTTLALAQPVFHPTINNRTIFHRDAYRDLATQGKFARIPYLAGNTDHESGFYRLAALAQNKTFSTDKWNLYEAEGFTCAARDAVKARAQAGVPTWRYRYFGDWDNLRLYPGSGAYHGSDLHMIFGASEDVTGIQPSAKQQEVVKMMQHAWAAFVKKPDCGLDELGWPRAQGTNGTANLVGLGFANHTSIMHLDPGTWDSICPTNGSVKEAQGAF